MRNYLCKKCATLVKSDKKPISFNCPSGGNHQWTDLGEVGTTNYQCQKCGLLLKSQKKPISFNCPSGGNHQWTQL
ncbi:MAG: hypothetical protein WAQ01_07765 [Bacteroidales bacterium]|nr:hypothetical protein [Rikenellaceae bacterium]